MIGKPESINTILPDLTARSTLYNLPRLRTDCWNLLRDNARRLRRLSADDAEARRLRAETAERFEFLAAIECYCAFPGSLTLAQLQQSFAQQDYELFSQQATRLVRLLTTHAYRKFDLSASNIDDYSDLLDVSKLSSAAHNHVRQEQRPYFEVLLLDDLLPDEASDVRTRLRSFRREADEFIYEVVIVSSFEDALLAVLLNPNIESVVNRNNYNFPANRWPNLLQSIYTILGKRVENLIAAKTGERSFELGRLFRQLRPELDLFLVTDAPVEDVAGEASKEYRRIFYQQEDYQDLHLSLLKGVHERFETPFFEALRRYSQKPTGMFHALPISRGRTISKSHWIGDLGKFYGNNVFLAETSATTGGLDSLLQPTGPLKRAQELAARAFGARRTYFVTNGTSTANKIVMQALVRPGDIVMLAHDCHKSHPYAVILAGALPVYLDAYPLTEYSMYGGVPLREIKRQLLELKRAGKLDQVRMLLLTNLTFDGITYDPYRIMTEILAIKPDMIFVWDEAWFAYGRFSPILRGRTAMAATERLLQRLKSPAYRAEYRQWKEKFEQSDPDYDATWLDQPLLPDPELARVRVYATHSTHKTLTALRQGSVIHIHDQDFELRVQEVFHEAYMTHTSTSPNYQILATLDVGRRQVELEGYDLLQRSIELAFTLRRHINSDPLLQKYFHILEPQEMVPAGYRSSGLTSFDAHSSGGSSIEQAWQSDEFVLDPTRVTLHVGRTGMDGDTFKNMLINRFDIHINKTSRNTLLFLIHIGMTRGTIAHLVKVLTQIAQEIDDLVEHQSDIQRQVHQQQVASLTTDLPPLPNFSRFHPAFLPAPNSTTPEGHMREAFFLSYDDSACEFFKLDGSVAQVLATGREVASASFVTPYPPGFPILVPGQVVTKEILAYIKALDVKEIHGYDPQYGLRVFSEAGLARLNGNEAKVSLPKLKKKGTSA